MGLSYDQKSLPESDRLCSNSITYEKLLFGSAFRLCGFFHDVAILQELGAKTAGGLAEIHLPENRVHEGGQLPAWGDVILGGQLG